MGWEAVRGVGVLLVEGGEEDEKTEGASAEGTPSYLQFFDFVFGYKEGQ